MNQEILGDCLEVMPTLESGSVDLTVTSPPYDNLRTYNGNATFDFEEIAKELFRVTKIGGVVVWVVGDATVNFCESLSSFKQVISFVDVIGFNLLDTMIYYKENYAPAYPTLRRYASQFEYMFVFSKGKPKIFNPIQEHKVRNKEEKVAYRQTDGSLRRKVKLIGRETKDASNVWSFPVGGNLTGHPAVFPLQLATNHILSWSNKESVVLDPFAGSFTTAIACINTSRQYICIERDPEYYRIGTQRIREHLDKKSNELQF